MGETYWLADDGDEEYRQVSKEEYVSAERAAGFRNTLGQPQEPATSAFSSTRYPIRGRIAYVAAPAEEGDE